MAHVRELKADVARLKEELARACAARDSLDAHFALALAAARDADSLAADATLLIVDGWNVLLGASGIRTPGARRDALAAKEDGLRRRVRAWLDSHPTDRAWIVFDGPRINGVQEGRLRISWTGGTGDHRADRLVCDYLRMRRLVGATGGVVRVVTDDKDFRKLASGLGAEVVAVQDVFGRATSAAPEHPA